ncbi:MAG: hypothetical protein J7501_16500, partial [Bdellovibrio sp.]|nr:hypothetical protein [Bdellovibrio sp.]
MSSLFSPKNSKWVVALLLLAGCQSIQTREDIRRQQQPQTGRPSTQAPQQQHPQYPQYPSQTLPPVTTEPNPEVPSTPPPAPVIPALPKIGIILGAGGAKTYAHIGFLHELARAKVPVAAIGGVEFAAPMAALYANREQANDVEWQMFKLKDEEVMKKSLLGNVNKNNDVSVLREFYSTAFSRVKAEDFRVPFACPSYNLKKNQVYLMNRGGLEQLPSM